MPGSVSHALTSTLDIVPTIAKLAGVALPTNRTFDGTCVLGLLWAGRGCVRGRWSPAWGGILSLELAVAACGGDGALPGAES